MVISDKEEERDQTMLFRVLTGAASIPTNDFVPTFRRTNKHHSLAFQIHWLKLIFTSAVSSSGLSEIKTPWLPGTFPYIYCWVLQRIK